MLCEDGVEDGDEAVVGAEGGGCGWQFVGCAQGESRGWRLGWNECEEVRIYGLRIFSSVDMGVVLEGREGAV